MIMRKIFLTLEILMICLAVSSSGEAAAQDYVAPPVTISKEKVKLDGKAYYSHIVLEKQTLYSIAKAYQVDIEDIYAANPSIKETGLKKNAIILIPVKEPAAVEEPGNDRQGVKADKATDRKAAREEKRRRKAAQKDFFIHTVRWYENLDAISEKYGVPAEIIMEINGLEGRKLKNRQQLKIPTNLEEYMEKEAGKADDAAPEKTEGSNALPEKTGPDYSIIDRLTERNKVRALLMLPFNAASETPSSICMDFYSGALLAAKELGDAGTDIELSVYDTYGDALPITEERLAKSDFVIGPPSLKGLTDLLALCPESTSVISPLDTRTAQLVQTHSNFIQVPSPSIVQYEDLLKWIGEDRGVNDSIVIIYEKGIKDLRKEAEFQEIIGASHLEHSSFSYSILEGRDILDSLASKLTLEGVNRVLVASESEAFVNDVVRNLNLLIHNRYNIVLYGASRIRSYETIDVANLHNASLHTSASYYIDYDTPEVRDFLMKYRALFNTEPSQMAFQGYDIMYFFSEICSGYGNGWSAHLTSENRKMLMSDFSFIKTGEGLERNAVRRVIYGPDYSVTLVR